MATKALYFLPHIHPFTHSFKLGVLLMDTMTLGQVEPGIEPPTHQQKNEGNK